MYSLKDINEYMSGMASGDIARVVQLGKPGAFPPLAVVLTIDDDEDVDDDDDDGCDSR